MKKLLALAVIGLVLLYGLGAWQWEQIGDLQEELGASYQKQAELYEVIDEQQEVILKGTADTILLQADMAWYKALYERRYQPDPLEIEQLIDFNQWAMGQHQYYVDNPEKQNAYTGDTAFQEWVIGNYDRTINELEAWRTGILLGEN